MTENGNMYMPVGPVGYSNGDGMFGGQGALSNDRAFASSVVI